jgi:hypothetical protein
MTSEVLMLNKDAVVIAADSAVTTGRDPHPRYSKSANKIFDMSVHGNVALTIYDNADIDRVPWELAVKLFRMNDPKVKTQRPKLVDYQTDLLSYLQGNASLFPASVRSKLLAKRLFAAAVHVLHRVAALQPIFADQSALAVDRQAGWTAGATSLNATLAGKPLQSPLVSSDLSAAQAQAPAVLAEITPELATDPKFLHADPSVLVPLAVQVLVKEPFGFLESTGVVIAGYGKDEIFPSFTNILIYGHVGGTLLWSKERDYAVDHENAAWIQPFAQSSMIDRFTDGFDAGLRAINHKCGADLIDNLLADLQAGGVVIPPTLCNPIRTNRHGQFMAEFQRKNLDENFFPLRRILNSLSVPEMGHLAESLLVLEALRERVTSPSESIGGPIDVAVITKSEGLVWLKRKHFFEPGLNLRYQNRSKIH